MQGNPLLIRVGIIFALLGLAVHGLFYYFTGVKWFLASAGFTAVAGALIALAGRLWKSGR